MSFKDISYLDLWWLFCSVLGKFGRGHHKEHFCENTLNLDGCRLKDFLSRDLETHVQ